MYPEAGAPTFDGHYYQVTTNYAFDWRATTHPKYNTGGPPIHDQKLGNVHNALLHAFAQLPESWHGAVYMDNLFINPRVLGWLSLLFLVRVCGTVNEKFNAGGAKAATGPPKANKTGCTLGLLRRTPPRVSFYRGFTLMAAYDTGITKMVLDTMGMVTQNVSLEKMKRAGSASTGQ